ncbi:MAG: A/G-specific adenine glycosylase [Promethearchaeota archaeon]|nr:MAG: A/G-specific adenine glycosylase [Candidatus Lokiarchaeota archaeon]
MPEINSEKIQKCRDIYEKNGLNKSAIKLFQDIIYEYYDTYKINFPWRQTEDPYHILVSEIMLQQTQVNRVIKKFQEFIGKFPSFHTLADSSLEEVLKAWQGLGYNRRAIYLKKCAEIVVDKYEGKLPKDRKSLKDLPGIGDATSASIMAFAYNKPVNLIETNIRTLYIYFFLYNDENISDSDIIEFVEKTLDRNNPRKWYNALMDYGRMIKKNFGNLSRKSKKYTKQKPFKGSDRQIRGIILSFLLKNGETNQKTLLTTLKIDNKRLFRILNDLKNDGFITAEANVYKIL